MIDLHCHVLPGVDDGPGTIEEAIALARGAEGDGIATIAATPHVDSAHPSIDSGLIRTRVRELQTRLEAARVGVRIVTGAELGSSRAMELDDAELRRLSLGGGGWLLLECPIAATLTPGFTGIARALAARGHGILLAHPERCPLFLRSPQLLDELIAEGMLAQVTAGALRGQFGRVVRDFALGLIERDTAQVIASDGHGSHRPARIARELEGTRIDQALTTWLAHDVPAALLTGAELPPRPETAPRRPRRHLLRLAGR
jgi:protein-tyrosine phosphatase